MARRLPWHAGFAMLRADCAPAVLVLCHAQEENQGETPALDRNTGA